MGPGGAGKPQDHVIQVQDHVIQVAGQDSPPVTAIRDSGDSVAGLKVGDTTVLISQRLGRVSGTFQRPTIGATLQNENVRIRHIHSHWDMVADIVSPYEHISFGAWATVAPEIGGNANFNYRYESNGDGYLAALDSARTPVASLPISGTATYSGQYTGFIKGHGADGVVLKSDGDVDITADFANAALTVEMLSTSGRGLALSGSIQENGFSGTTIVHMANSTLLQVAGATASMEGGFYGDSASEAGGVFEIVGGRAQDPGRFAGAFGGKEAN